MSDTTPMPLEAHTEGDQCPTCAKMLEEKRANDETSFAFLLALVPVLSLTFFGQVGLL